MVKPDGLRHMPMEGVEVWKNQKNKFFIFQAHYTADPAKRSEEYRLDKQNSLPRRQYLMEYELHWESFSGLPVFGDTFLEKTHVNKSDMYPEIGLPLLLGFDFGLTPACLITQLSGQRLRCFREFQAVNMGAKRFLSYVVKELRLNYSPWGNFKKDVIAFIDPSGQFRKDTDESTCANIISENGFGKIIPGAIAFEERRTSVEHFLTQMEGGLPCMEISASGCPMLIKGFLGGYSFKEGQDEIEPSKLDPLKNEYSHLQDALQMICSKVMRRKNRVTTNVPTPKYTWSK